MANRSRDENLAFAGELHQRVGERDHHDRILCQRSHRKSRLKSDTDVLCSVPSLLGSANLKAKWEDVRKVDVIEKRLFVGARSIEFVPEAADVVNVKACEWCIDWRRRIRIERSADVRYSQHIAVYKQDGSSYAVPTSRDDAEMFASVLEFATMERGWMGYFL